MPAGFEKCRAEGGKIITKVIKPGETYIHICKDKSGKWHEGEVKKYQKLNHNKK